MHQPVDPDDADGGPEPIPEYLKDYVNEWLKKTFMEGKSDLQSFLDQAYLNNSRTTWSVSPGVGGPHEGYTELMAYVRLAMKRFDAVHAPEHPAYAVLLNPEDKLMVQYEAAQTLGINLFVEPERAANTYYGLIMHPAMFVERGHYMIICEEDYHKLSVPENLM